MASPIIGIGGGGGNMRNYSTVGQNQSLADYSPETQAELARQERRRQIMTAIMQQGLEGGPAYASAGRFIVPRGWASGAADLAKTAIGAWGMNKADEAGKEATTKEQQAYADAIKAYKAQTAGTPAQPGQQVIGTSEDDNTMTAPTPAQPATPESRQKAILALMENRIPAAQRYGLMQQGVLDTATAREDTQAAKKADTEAVLGQRKYDTDVRAKEQQAARDMEDKRARELQAERLAAQRQLQSDKLDQQADMKKFQIQMIAQNRQLPPPVLKEANDIVDVQRGVGLVNLNLQKHIDRINDGTLDLGVFRNWLSQGKNLAGISDAQSRAFSDLMTDLETSRNAILVAAKGVQTEGDALRAMNQILDSKTDPKNVANLLQKQIENNKNLISGQDKKLTFLYSNYNIPPTKQMGATPAAAPATPAPATGAPKRIKFDAQGNPAK